MLAAARTEGLQDPRYASARAKCKRLGADAIDQALLVAATAGPAWLIVPVNGDH